MKHMLHYLPDLAANSDSFINYSKITCFIISTLRFNNGDI